MKRLRIALAFLGMWDCPEYTQRIGLCRAWQIAGIILERNSELESLRKVAQ
jgi:hypothetical protein